MKITITIPDREWFWRKLMLFSYRKLATPITVLPTGIPGNRDPENVCTAFSPRKRGPGDVGECESDGHYLCDECCLKNGRFKYKMERL